MGAQLDFDSIEKKVGLRRLPNGVNVVDDDCGVVTQRDGVWGALLGDLLSFPVDIVPVQLVIGRFVEDTARTTTRPLGSPHLS